MEMQAECIDFKGRQVADHVPTELIRRIDFFQRPGMEQDPFSLARDLRSEPPLIYNTWDVLRGQCWMLTGSQYYREIIADPDRFSCNGLSGFAEIIGERWQLGLQEMDQPLHGKFRSQMTSWFGPRFVNSLSLHVRQRAVELIDAVADKGGCDFVSSFGTPFPISIFIEMMGLPRDMTETFLVWVDRLLHSNEMGERVEASRASADYLRETIMHRRSIPTDDLAGRVVRLEVDGEPISDDEMLGMCYLLFLGGLDTVAASLGFHFKHLAANPHLQERLRNNPADIPRAVEELLRAFAPSTTYRRALVDMDFGDVRVKAGDWIHIVHSFTNLDPEEFPDPDTVDFDRRLNRHVTFGTGFHNCLGSHLARRELQIALEEWTTRLPIFRLDDDAETVTHGGLIFGVSSLPLRWD